MAYATQADLTPSVIPGKTLMELTDDERTGQIDVAVVQDALDKASGIVEMYCRNRYTLPLQQTEELAGITSAIAAYRLYSRRPGAAPDEIRATFDDAMKLLRDIAAEKAGLDQPIGATQQTTSGQVVKSHRHQVFGDRNMEGFN